MFEKRVVKHVAKDGDWKRDCELGRRIGLVVINKCAGFQSCSDKKRSIVKSIEIDDQHRGIRRRGGKGVSCFR
ncbi:uncharacterized protein YALI1_F24578g [Yarrowia lipolytica]|uniref:Uncharacterized protein n=1 Tax=Yarrowia lipolytica TaxID=4952 RepID=A0A1D8NP02_YARLL|nr:hypothetical protein YALI1_F24578g [Yarrowia lipolytica]